jgi:RHS repeat-associated protein
MTTDASGNQYAEIRYKAWGESRYTYGTSPTKHTYTGQYSNVSDFGLMYYNARWYDSALGRFSQPDTYVPDSQGVQAWDRYAYVNNSPVMHNDPSGHCIICLVAAIGGGVILGTAIFTNFIRAPSAPTDGNASTLSDLLLLGYEHADHANITGEGLQSLQDDPSVQAAQERLVDLINDDPRYGQEAYFLSDSEDLSSTFTANGSSRDWIQAALENNQAFFMVHTGTLSATNTTVAADGTISTTWKVSDNFDYLPDFEDHGFDYNFFAVLNYLGYNIVLGAKEQYPTNAYWQDTILSQ